MAIGVSVVVPTYQRADLLRRCLEALLAQDYDPAGFEIIVVDDGASDATRQVVDVLTESARAMPDRAPKFASLWADGGTTEQVMARLTRPSRGDVPEIRYIAMDRRSGPAAARNVGWRAGRGEIVAFTDDDCIPAPGWLSAGVAAFCQDTLGVSGRITIPLSKEPTDYELNASYLAYSEFVTANCFYRRSALETVGGFDERFRAAWREDSDLYFTLLENVDQTCLVSAPSALVIHPVRRAPWGISVQQQRKSQFNALLYKKHPHLYRERLAPVTPWHYYGIVIALVLAVFALIAGRRDVALVGMACWLVLTCQFLMQRLRQTSREWEHVAEMALTSFVIPPLALFWRWRGALRYRVLFF